MLATVSTLSPADALCYNHVVITPEWRHEWRHFDVMTTLLLRHMFDGSIQSRSVIAPLNLTGWRHDIEAFFRLVVPFVRRIHRWPVDSRNKKGSNVELWCFYVKKNKILSNLSTGRWFGAPWRSCDVTVIQTLNFLWTYTGAPFTNMDLL